MDTAYTIIGEDSFKTSAADAVEGQETDSINGDKDTYSQSTDNYASYRKRSNMSAFISDDLQKKVKSINGESNNRRNPEYIKNEMSQIEGLSESSVKVFEYLKDGPAVVDNIIDKTGLSAAEVLAAVTELEIRGAIEVLAGNICRIK